jgi:hypothetical protein
MTVAMRACIASGTSPPGGPNKPAACAGFSLLEVLVSCGLLVLGLAGLAAILPAAGARLNDAASQDRAVSAVTMAFDEIETRGLLTVDLFPATAPFASGSGAIMIGAGLSNATALTNTLSSGTLAANGAGTIGTKIDTTGDRGFFLEDEVEYDTAADGFPINSFSNGVRTFNRGVCWGAMVVPLRWGTPPTGMSLARVSVAVFRKPPVPITIELRQVSGDVYVLWNPSDETTRKTYLKACGYVLAVPPATTTPPLWLAINASWQEGPATDASQRVAFRTTVPSNLLNGSILNVIGFEKLILVSEKNLPVQ